MQKFINIHTHYKQKEEVLGVINIEENYRRYSDFDICSLGIHPWFAVAESLEIQLKDLEKYATGKNVFAIGECGLDKLCQTDWLLQEKAFLAQIAVANKIRKPLIIHCVRAYSEVVQCLGKMNNKVPVIFHGFNKNVHIAQNLVKEGYYLSFGASLIKKQHLDSLRICPPTQLFFETDKSEIGIELVYKEAAALLALSVTQLIKQVEINYQRVKNQTLNK